MPKKNIDLNQEVNGRVDYGFLATDAACENWAERQNVPVPVSDSFWIKSKKLFKMYSLNYSQYFNAPVSGLQQGLQAVVDSANPTDDYLVIPKTEYEKLKKFWDAK